MPSDNGRVTLKDLQKAHDDGTVDTVLLVLADMEGRLQGKRMTTDHFLGEVVEHNAEGCNYLLAVDVDMNTVDGYAMSSWERGYGDFVMRPDFDTLRRIPWHPATVLLMADLEWEDGRDVVESPRQILRRQLARLAERGLEGDGRHRARVHRLPRLLRGRVAQGLPRPRPGQRVQRRLLDDRDRPRRAADPPDPQLDDGRGHARGELEGRVQLRPARDQLPLRRRADDRGRPRRSTRPGPRRSPRRRGWRSPSWPSSTSARATRATSTARSPASDGNVFGTDEALFHKFVAGQLACLRELTLFFAPHVNSYKRFAKGSFAPTAVAWGKDNRTCSMRVVGHGRLAAGGEPAARRRRQPVSCPGRDDRRRTARDRQRPGARAALRGQRLRVRQAARAAQPVRRARPVRGQRRRARGVRRRGRRPLPEPRARRDRGAWRRPSPTGSASAGSKGCEPAGDRDMRRDRACALGSVGPGSDDGAALVRARRPARGRVRAADAARPSGRVATRTRSSTGSTGCCWPAARTSTRPPTAPIRIRRRAGPGRSATPSSWR